MSRSGGASSSWNGRASVSAPALRRAGGATPAVMNWAPNLPTCRSSFGGWRVGEVRTQLVRRAPKILGRCCLVELRTRAAPLVLPDSGRVELER